MREIKFRAWDCDNKIMVYPDSELEVVFCFDKIGLSIYHSTGYELNSFEVMQYTGLKDKNGKEIYEGDIVKYKVKGSDKTYTTVMKFNEDHGAFLFGIYEGVKMPCGKKTRMNKYTRKSVGSVEVIGNIYENPGLLEGN
jgi:uncharacterized phage protein (TIGR01671 family)